MHKAHRYAEMFPALPSDRFRALVEDIRRNGQREPIMLLDGLVLNGRARVAACEQLKLTPKFNALAADRDPIEYLLMANLIERPWLETGPRAAAAVRAAEFKKLPWATFGKVASVGLSSCRRAKLILQYGSLSDRLAMDSGRETINAIEQRIRRKRNPVELALPRRPPPPQAVKERGPARPAPLPRVRTEQAMGSRYWADLKLALEHLTALPLASDVAPRVAKLPSIAAIINRKLPIALKWLEDFAHDWNAQQRTTAQSGVVGDARDHAAHGTEQHHREDDAGMGCGPAPAE